MIKRVWSTERGAKRKISYTMRQALCVMLLTLCTMHHALCTYGQDSSSYVEKAWAQKGRRNFKETYRIIKECITKFSDEADEQASGLKDFPPTPDISNYQIMNDVATCYFIKGEALRDEGHILKEEGNLEEAEVKLAAAKKAFKVIVKQYPYAKAFDPAGWYWKIKTKALRAIAQIEGKDFVDPPPVVEEEIPVRLHDEGEEFPVDYAKYGKFEGVGTKHYRYAVSDPIGLSKAVGEGIYPNTSSVRFDPEFVKIKKKLPKIDHWDIANSRDLRTAFYKWCYAPESPGVSQFFIADILERSGLIKQAIKAYYAILVHFPRSYGWTYWNTPWYVGKVALYRLKHILQNNPQLGLKLEGGSIEIIAGFDNQLRNDAFIVNPGKLVRMSFPERLRSKISGYISKRTDYGKEEEVRGNGKIKLVKYASGDWQMLVNGRPFVVKAITYAPTRVGETPHKGTLKNWTTQDVNDNGIVDAPYEAWVDKNCNNVKDLGENRVGDFRLMKLMGVNSIRLYHHPMELNKELFRDMHKRFGIYVILGDFLGKYALGSGADWSPGTDYDNLEHKKNMLDSVRKMVDEYKDEPYILIWMLGNENVYGLGCNADKKPESFFEFANEAAKLIKSIDPLKRPVAIASGDTLYLDIFAEKCPDIDIYGGNVYRGRHGFLSYWDDIKKLVDRPAMITEYGAPSYGKGYSYQEAQEYQAQYHKDCWQDIFYNSAGYGAGNAVGGIAFEWVDEWWKAYEEYYHDRHRLSVGPFLDGYFYEEWFGVTSQGDGKSSPFLRQLKKAYFTYKELWNN